MAKNRNALSELKGWFHSSARSPSPKGRFYNTSAAAAAQHQSRIHRLGLPHRDGRSARQFAIMLLRAGAEIEHSLLVQYLYAAYSIDDQYSQSHSGSPQTAMFTLDWKTKIRLVAREEMAHLITVQNLLLALDEDFYLERSPIQGVLNQSIPFALEPVSLASLGKYVILESPDEAELDPATRQRMKAVNEVVKKVHYDRLSRVGLIYAALYWLFLESDKPGSDWPFIRWGAEDFIRCYGKKCHLRKSDFISPHKYQDRSASAQEWGIYEVNAHADAGNPRDAALETLRWIMCQGEGPNAIEKSHFFRFLEMFEQFQQAGKPNMIFNVPTNPVTGNSSKHGSRIVNSDSRGLARLFNIRYQLLMVNILQSLSSSRSLEPTARKRYADWALAEMEFIRRLGQILPQLPFGAKIGAETGHAAAPFEMDKLSGSPAKQRQMRVSLRQESGNLIAKLRTSLNGGRPNIPGEPAERGGGALRALEPSLLDAIAQQDDRMVHV